MEVNLTDFKPEIEVKNGFERVSEKKSCSQRREIVQGNLLSHAIDSVTSMKGKNK